MNRTSILARNNVAISGGGPQPMLFAHGFGCDQAIWRWTAPAFADDYRVVLFDYVGAGLSDIRAYDAGRYGSLDGYAHDVLDICEALDLRNVVFVGHSVSTMIGVLAAIREPSRFARLILIGPSPRYLNDEGYKGGFERSDIEGLLEMMDKNFVAWAHFMAPMMMKNLQRPELARELEASFCRTDPRIARRFAEVTFLSDNRADLPLVSTPTLVMQCADDSVAPLPVGDYVHQNVRGSVLCRMRATGHCPHVSHPDETVAAIKDYLACTTR